MKYIKFFILIVISFLITNNVYASELVKKYSTYEFYRKSSTSGFSDKFYMYSIDGRTTYCVNPGVKLGTDYYLSDLDKLDLSDDEKNKILLIAYYGYDYKDHHTLKYYAASQALIWEAILGSDYHVSFHSDYFGKGFEFSIDRERTAIMDLVNNHYKEPSIKNKTYDIYFGEALKLNDDLLSNYTSKYNIVNNSVEITPDLNEKNVIFYRKNYYNYNYELYQSGNYQDMLSGGNFSNDFFKINLNVISGSIEIKKIDEDNNLLDGVIIDLYDENYNYINSYTTENGFIKINNLKMGKYYLKEKSTLSYLNLDDTLYEINISKENKDSFIELKNYFKKYNVKVKKFDYKNLNGISNTIFSLYDINDNYINEFKTDLNGILEINDLKIGKYYILEKEANKEYVKDDKKYYFDIKDSDIYLEISNKKITGTLKIIEQEEDSNLYLNDVYFDIFDINDNYIDTVKTDNNGIILYELEYGQYYFIETKTKTGYLLNNEKKYFNIEKNNDIIIFELKNKKENIIFKINENVIKVPITEKNKNILEIIIPYFLLGSMYYCYVKKSNI